MRCARGGLLVLLFSAGLAAAEVYRWTDAEGRVHFGDRPPASGAEVVPLRSAPSAAGAPDEAERRARQQRLLQAYGEERLKKKEAARRQAADAAARRRRCLDVRDRLRRYQRGVPLYRLDDAGRRVYLEEAQRAALIGRLQRAERELCQ
ncbi:DUF4124 domain-containing protein [Thiohalobacter sp. IOR34]|uniref:DUF4124 domain-containing protein n=1 Tax=Thiohalobacter sp. IOR34 TaxID=3057176 RepID=UPI0025B1B39F|nr:DUF4124 domain-containing protein [Thiohalobacter sp. IOR34]WJW75662.1 DUF4124 domain-containing protein [Thiohalobacter sp. IOR34]